MRIAVGIPTNNRPNSLLRAVRSVINQTELPDELIIVDDGNLDKNILVRIEDMLRNKGVHFEYYHKSPAERGLTRSRNFIAKLATSDIIQFIDDDAELNPKCIELVKKIFLADTTRLIAAVDFPIEEVLAQDIGRRLIEFCYRIGGLWTVGRRFYGKRKLTFHKLRSVFPDLEVVDYLHGGSFAIRRDYLLQVGGFDESLGVTSMGEDRDISIKLLRLGLLLRVSSVRVVHYSEPGGRVSPQVLGYESAYNYLYIITRNLRLGMGEWLLILYNLYALILTECLFVIIGRTNYHIAQIVGIIKGIGRFVREKCQPKV